MTSLDSYIQCNGIQPETKWSGTSTQTYSHGQSLFRLRFYGSRALNIYLGRIMVADVSMPRRNQVAYREKPLPRDDLFPWPLATPTSSWVSSSGHAPASFPSVWRHFRSSGSGCVSPASVTRSGKAPQGKSHFRCRRQKQITAHEINRIWKRGGYTRGCDQIVPNLFADILAHAPGKYLIISGCAQSSECYPL